MFTGSVFGSPGCALACGLWQSRHSPDCAPRCGTLAVSIFFACSSWQVTQSALVSVCVSTTLPSFAVAWQMSQVLSANGGCRNFAISLGPADWCGSWQLRQFAVPN